MVNSPLEDRTPPMTFGGSSAPSAWANLHHDNSSVFKAANQSTEGVLAGQGTVVTIPWVPPGRCRQGPYSSPPILSPSRPPRLGIHRGPLWARKQKSHPRFLWGGSGSVVSSRSSGSHPVRIAGQIIVRKPTIMSCGNWAHGTPETLGATRALGLLRRDHVDFSQHAVPVPCPDGSVKGFLLFFV